MLVTAKGHSYQIPFKTEDDENGLCGYCPKVPGIVVFGETLDEAKEAFKISARVYVECCLDAGDTIPSAFVRQPQSRNRRKRRRNPVQHATKDKRVAFG